MQTAKPSGNKDISRKGDHYSYVCTLHSQSNPTHRCFIVSVINIFCNLTKYNLVAVMGGALASYLHICLNLRGDSTVASLCLVT